MGFQILNSVDAAYTAMGKWFSSDTAIQEAGAEGYLVLDSGSVVAGTNAGTVKVSAGTDQFALTKVTYALTDNIACAANADATNPRWQLIEVDSSGVAQSNLGTAASTPVPPAPTAGRVVHAAVYIPAAATTVDALLSTANGKAKIIDKRVVTSGNPVQTFSNADVTCAAATQVLIQTGTLSATRTITLPLASAVGAGNAILIIDASGTAGSFPMIITRSGAGSDQINGTALTALSVNYGSVLLLSDGTSKFTIGVAPIAFGGTSKTTVATAADNFLGTSTRGDLPYRGASAVVALAKGTSGQYLKIGANDPSWATIPTVATDVIFDAKGDLAVGTGADTSAALTVSATQGQTQLVDSSAATGLVYGYAIPATSVYLAPTNAISETIPRHVAGGTAVSLASGTLQLQAIFLPKNVTVTSISFRSTGAASTPTHWWFSLLNSSRVWLRNTGDQTTTAWGATTTKTVNLSSTFTTTYEGLHYLGIMMTGTTPTTLPAVTSTTNIAGVAPILGGTSSTSMTTPITPDGSTAATAITATAGQIYGWCS